MDHPLPTSNSLLIGTLCASLLIPAALGANRFKLGNEEISAEFDAAGLVRVSRLKSTP